MRIGLKWYVESRIKELKGELQDLEKEANEIAGNPTRYKAVCERIAFINGAIEELEMLADEFDL